LNILAEIRFAFANLKKSPDELLLYLHQHVFLSWREIGLLLEHEEANVDNDVIIALPSPACVSQLV
jgi:hypothetical protein